MVQVFPTTMSKVSAKASSAPNASEELGLRWTLLSVLVTLALALTTVLDVLTTLVWYQSGGVDGNPITRQVIAALGVDRWAALRCLLTLPFVLLVILVPHLLPLRMPLRWRRAYLVCACLLALVIVTLQTQTVAYNIGVLGWLR